MAGKIVNTRKIVLEILMEAEGENIKFSSLLKNVLDKYDYLDRQDKAFISRLSKGCIERRITLDYIIGIYAKTGNKKMKPIIRCILRMGIYQIMYMDSVKDFAACSEAVELTKDRGLRGLAGFVNGVLRTIVREKDSIKMPDKNKRYNDYLSVYYSMPLWIVDYLLKEYDKEKTVVMLEAFNKEAPVTIRVNEGINKEKISEIISFIKASGIEVTKHPYYEYAYTIQNMAGAAELPGFTEGLITIQDVSSQLDMALAGIKKGDNILDMCAAPGGKTMHASVLTGEDGHVEARDISTAKLSLIEENATRLHRNNISYRVFDASEDDKEAYDKYDVVVLDAPCSGLGVMGRKPDIRYNITMKDIESLASLQKKMLGRAVNYLKKGGILIYSTCTITGQENIDAREYAISELGLVPYGFNDELNEELKNDIDIKAASDGYIQFLPGVTVSDGFFISRYKKV